MAPQLEHPGEDDLPPPGLDHPGQAEGTRHGAAPGTGAPGEGRRRTGSSEAERQGEDDRIRTKAAEGDGLNSAVEAKAQAVGLESRGEWEGRKSQTRMSDTEQATTTTTTIQRAIQGTMDKEVRPAQRQGGGPQGRKSRGTREDTPGLDHPGRGEKEELVP